jgi:hypothetical protein
MAVTPREPTIGTGKLTYEDVLGLVSANLGNLLYNHVRENRLGRIFYAPMDVILDAHTVVEPASSTSPPRAPKSFSRMRSSGRRTSPSRSCRRPRPTATRASRPSSARASVEHYWLVDPIERTLEAFHLGGAARADLAPPRRSAASRAGGLAHRPRVGPVLDRAVGGAPATAVGRSAACRPLDRNSPRGRPAQLTRRNWARARGSRRRR